jgi:hypothetical protein
MFSTFEHRAETGASQASRVARNARRRCFLLAKHGGKQKTSLSVA